MLCHTGITSNQVLIITPGTDNLTAWWIYHNASVALRYMVSCSVVSNTTTKAAVTVMKTNILIKGDILLYTANIDHLLPSTKYNCCVMVIEHNSVESTFLDPEICEEAVTLTQVTKSLSAATIALIAMLVITLPCASVLLFIIKKQRTDAKKMIINW